MHNAYCQAELNKKPHKTISKSVCESGHVAQQFERIEIFWWNQSDTGGFQLTAGVNIYAKYADGAAGGSIHYYIVSGRAGTDSRIWDLTADRMTDRMKTIQYHTLLCNCTGGRPPWESDANSGLTQ